MKLARDGSRDYDSAGGVSPHRWGWIALGLGIVGGISFDGLTRWVCVAAVLATAPLVLRQLPPTRRTMLADKAPIAVLIAMCVGLLWPLWWGQPPASRDHGIHYYQVHLLVHEMLPRGELSGWVTDFNNGYPYGESYPVLGYLWCAGPHLLSFGFIDLRTSYAWGLLGVWLLSVFAIYRLGRTVAEELGDSAPSARWVGTVAALVWLTDPGGSRMGGWTYTMFHGVWTQLLSTSLWLLSLTYAWGAWRRPTPRRLAITTLLLGGSILAHPFGLLTAVVSGFVWLGVLLFGRHDAPAGKLWWWALVHIGAALLAAGWLATFFAAADSMKRGPVVWEDLAGLAAGLVRGDLFAGPWVWAGPAVIVGGFVLVRRAGPCGWLLLGLVATMLVLASRDAITVLRLDLVVSGFKNLQFPRWSIAIKPVLFVVAAVGVVATARAVAAAVPRRVSETTLPTRFVAALLFAPLCAALVTESERLVPRPIGGIDTLAEAGLAAEDTALVSYLHSERQAFGGEIRVAFLRRGMTGAMWPLLSLADARVPIVVDGHVATINFKHRVASRKPSVLAAMGVTHVLWDGNLQTEPELPEGLTELARFGPLHLARLDQPPALVPALLVGSGTLQITEAGARGMDLSVSGARSDSRLSFHNPPHAKWVLRHEGEQVDLEGWGSAIVRSRVVHPADGQYTLRYEDTSTETRARWVSWSVAALAFVALFWSSPVRARGWSPTPGQRRVLVAAAGVALLAGLVGVASRQRTQLADRWTEYALTTRPAHAAPVSFVRDLVIDGDVQVERTPPIACSGIHTKDALLDCVEVDHAPRVGIAYDDPYLYRCLQVSVPPRGEARITFDRVSPQEVVLGTVSHAGDKHKKVQFTVAGQTRSLGRHIRHLRLRGVSDEPLGEVLLKNPHRQPQKVCIAAAAFAVHE